MIGELVTTVEAEMAELREALMTSV
jgi:hypothetical protein